MDYRTETFFSQGLLDEVKFLKAEGLTTAMQAGTCIGYKQTLDYLDKVYFNMIKSCIRRKILVISHLRIYYSK